mmetsp:Transcript_357/g.813  ORF Transcript_357/g.813 Transcript_357/m.813 type:complete len:1571 (-) Transcript_357:629-5341(-)
MAPKLQLSFPDNIAKVSVQRRRVNVLNFGLYHIPFLVLYVFAFKACYETAGTPYATALAHHKLKGYDPEALSAGLKAAKPAVVDEWGGKGAATSKKGAAAAIATDDESDPWGDLEAEDEAPEVSGAAAVAAAAGIGNESGVNGLNGTSAEGFCHANGTNATGGNCTGADSFNPTYETPPSLPARWLPEFWAVAAIAALAVSHALLGFAQHWSVKFRAYMMYSESSEVDTGKRLMFVPMPHQGKAEIVAIKSLEIPDASAIGGVRTMLWTVFQRQRFEYVETERDARTGKARGEVREVETPVALPLSSYLKPTRGMTPGAVMAAISRYGDNSLKVPLPTFLSLYKEQLMGPVTVFQVFTVLLWLMDEYWKYALFSACSLLMFEATTAFSRIKNIRTLRGMGTNPWRIQVLREGQWTERSTEDLVPGDLVSLTRLPGGVDTAVPCDCLVLRGSAVVNEASLTGESVPQMKDSLSAEAVASDPHAPLDINGEHKVNVLYSGTTLMQQSPGDAAESAVHLPKTPDGGCLCYVLQTGFGSTQGKLMRMMEFSSEQVTGDTWETLILLFILLVFALMASGHVFIKGMKDGKRSQYELVLRCILILTSVVPPELPMQTAMAVNTALLALMRAAVFCTEPFRVPLAGKVETCLFDKTGTLTSDKLVAMGIVSPSGGGGTFSELVNCAESNKSASLVIAGCHSLVQVDGKTFGDPLEQAALMGIKWRFDPKTQTAAPNEHFKDPARDKAIAEAEEKQKEAIAKLPPGAPQPPPLPKPQPPKRSWKGTPAVKILVRNHFSSALQRMSAVAAVTQTSGESSQDQVLMKGSPEMVATLLAEKPKGYDAAYRKLAEQGMRIIALAHRQLSSDESARLKSHSNPLTRDEMERGLTFDGFLAFACPVRTDTPDVIRCLRASSHNVMMATGDSALTALHVANEVGIAEGGLERALMLVVRDSDGLLEWASAKTDEKSNKPIKTLPYLTDGSMVKLSQQYSLCVTGQSLNAAAAQDGFNLGKNKSGSAGVGMGGGNKKNSGGGGLWDYLDSVVIFARMSPDDKERVLKRLKQQGRHTFMCGDGANDVGALKQAHVGVALLSGFGGANTKKVTPVGEEAGAPPQLGPDGKPLPPGTQVATVAAKAETFQEKMKRVQEAATKAKEAKAVETAMRKQDQAELMVMQKTWFEEELAIREAAGTQWAQIGAMKAATVRMMDETRRRQMERQKALGGPMAVPGFREMMSEMEGMEDAETPQVKLGDASMAAPFPSRIPSVRSAVDIIRQGRCTLVSAIQMQQVLVLSCLISAYSLSVLYLDGIRSSDNQMIASGSALTAASLAFSYATPVHILSPVRPLRSIFHPANFLSLCGQLVIHLACMVYAVHLVRQATGEFAEFPENIPVAIIPEAVQASATEEQRSIWAQGPPFKPSLLNTVVFLVETVQRVCVMLVNYKGRPFMMSAIENKTLLISLVSMVIGAFVCAFEVSPMLNTWLQLVHLPDNVFRVRILSILAATVGGTLAWDQLMLLIFAPHILFTGYRDTFRAMPRVQDLAKPAKRAVGVALIGYLYYVTDGSIAVILGAGYAFKQGLL